MAVTNPYAETIVPRAAVTFPLKVPRPDDFDPARLESWPRVVGRLEYVDGELWYMPPCGEEQQETTADVVRVLTTWRQHHREFVVGTNEAGMLLAGAVRGADAAVWRKQDLGTSSGGLRKAPPVLAVEVAGLEDTLTHLSEKAAWYLDRGVAVVWLLFPSERTAHVITRDGETILQADDTFPSHAALPGLAPRVREMFEQLDER
jgi:Uma2 family endonuclease